MDLSSVGWANELPPKRRKKDGPAPVDQIEVSLRGARPTPFGQFGAQDAELGHQPDSTVTLEQVAAAVRDKVRYTYDFGDDWEHDILVEKLLDPAGRPVVHDPADAGHQEMLDWLGLDDAGEFDPAHSNAREGRLASPDDGGRPGHATWCTQTSGSVMSPLSSHR